MKTIKYTVLLIIMLFSITAQSGALAHNSNVYDFVVERHINN